MSHHGWYPPPGAGAGAGVGGSLIAASSLVPNMNQISTIVGAGYGPCPTPDEMDCSMERAGSTTPSSRDGRRDSDGGSTSEQSSREARNKAEKNRRDRLTNCIKELLNFLPILKDYAKRYGAKRDPDKTTILRIGANQIRMSKYWEQLFHSRPGRAPVPADWGDDLENLICESMNAIFLIISSHGKVVYVSPCEQQLGHSQVQLLGEDIKKFIHPDDVHILKRALEPNGEPQRALLPIGLDDSSSDDTGTSTSMSSSQSVPSPAPPAPEAEADAPRLKSEQQERTFKVRMQTKSVQKNNTPHWALLDCDGFLEVPARFTEAGAAMVAQRTHSQRRKSSEVGSDEDVFLVLFARFATPGHSIPMYPHLTLMDRYVTRHSLDGCIINTDDRICHVSGYTPSEVLGKNAFDYMDPIDRRMASLALEKMLRSNELNGGSVYKLRTANAGFITLKTIGCLDEGGKSFVCTNIVIPPDEFQYESEELRRRLQPASITELADDADTSKHEIVKSSMTEPRKGRASVLHMAGSNIRRGHKRITESDVGLSPKRVCSTSTEVAGTLTPCVSESYLPVPVPPGGHSLHLLPGSSIVADVGHLAMQEDEVFPPNVHLGRSEDNLTAPAQDTFSTTDLTCDMSPCFLDSIQILPDKCTDVQSPNADEVLQKQFELASSLVQQQVDINQQQQFLERVPKGFPGRGEIEKGLIKATEEHQKQKRGYQELHRSTIQHAKKFGSVNT